MELVLENECDFLRAVSVCNGGAAGSGRASSIGQVACRTGIWRVIELMSNAGRLELHFTEHKELLKAFEQGITWKDSYFSHVGHGLERQRRKKAEGTEGAFRGVVLSGNIAS